MMMGSAIPPASLPRVCVQAAPPTGLDDAGGEPSHPAQPAPVDAAYPYPPQLFRGMEAKDRQVT